MSPQTRLQRQPSRRMGIAAVVAIVLVVGGVLFASSHLRNWQASYAASHAKACGTLRYAAGSLMSATADARAAEACFAHALPHCQAATLSASVMGVDTGATDTFLIQPPLGPLGGCQIVLTVSHWGLVPIANNTQTMTCQSVALAPDSLSVSACGSLGDITLPATHGAQWSS